MAAPTLTEILDYYQSLMARQYADLPRASANIRNYVAQANGENFLPQLDQAFNLDTAVGAQLDIIGKYIGVSRIVNVPLTTQYFGFWDYTVVDPDDQNPNGFYDYLNGGSTGAPVINVPAATTVTISVDTLVYSSRVDGDLVINADFIQSLSAFAYAEFFSYLNSQSNTSSLSDGQYRFLLRLQIVLNHSNGSLASIQDYLNQFFPNQITVVDNKDMTLSYSATTSVPLPIGILEAYLPRPMGVGITVTTV
jgi:hypothetical protein